MGVAGDVSRACVHMDCWCCCPLLRSEELCNIVDIARMNKCLVEVVGMGYSLHVYFELEAENKTITDTMFQTIMIQISSQISSHM